MAFVGGNAFFAAVMLVPGLDAGPDEAMWVAFDAGMVDDESLDESVIGDDESLVGQAEEEVATEEESANSTSTGGAAPVRTGQAGEAAVRDAYDIGPKVSAVINGRTRIFDGLNAETVSEVKNVKYQAFSTQLKDSLFYAKENSLRFDLYVRGGVNPTRISQPLQKAILDGDIHLRFIP
jgi:hypothetical protein